MKIIDKVKENKNILIIGSVFSVIIIAITIILLNNTTFIYYWDHVGYYENCLTILSNFKKSLIFGIEKTLYTMFFQDYNLLAGILPSILMAIFRKKQNDIHTTNSNILLYTIYIFIFVYC